VEAGIIKIYLSQLFVGRLSSLISPKFYEEFKWDDCEKGVEFPMGDPQFFERLTSFFVALRPCWPR
jgi:hypothetical protein